MEGTFEDLASLEEWFYDNETCFVVPYIETHFREVSYEHQYSFMLQHLFFTKIIIEDDKLLNEEKLQELFREMSFGKSKIIVIVGARDQGKTATAMLLAEEMHNRKLHNNIFYVGNPPNKDAYPRWMKFCNGLDDLPNGVIAIVDEASVRFSSRRSMTSENVELSQKMAILRHKGCTLIFMTQHLRMADTNIDRLSDIIIYKKAHKYGNERDKESDDIKLVRTRFKPKSKRAIMIEYRLDGRFRQATHDLPSFWDEEKVSKSFVNYHKDKKEEKARQLSQVVSPY